MDRNCNNKLPFFIAYKSIQTKKLSVWCFFKTVIKFYDLQITNKTLLCSDRKYLKSIFLIKVLMHQRNISIETREIYYKQPKLNDLETLYAINIISDLQRHQGSQSKMKRYHYACVFTHACLIYLFINSFLYVLIFNFFFN